MAGLIDIKLDLSKFDTKKKGRQIVEGMQKGIIKGAFLLEGKMKIKSPVKTGRYRSSISTTIGKLKASIGPKVVYTGWIEDGAKSKHAPRTHKSSRFKGHKIVANAVKNFSKSVIAIIEREIGRAIR